MILIAKAEKKRRRQPERKMAAPAGDIPLGAKPCPREQLGIGCITRLAAAALPSSNCNNLASAGNIGISESTVCSAGKYHFILDEVSTLMLRVSLHGDKTVSSRTLQRK